jgi:nucleoside-triphosphatase
MTYPRAILLTGSPGCGKTTLIRRAVELLPGPVGGFYTQEIREGRARKGFEMVTLDGQRGVLAHVNIAGRKRVGKYGVDISVLDVLGVEAIERSAQERGVVVIDEIGPMEILSDRFRQAVLKALDSDAVVLGTIVKRSTCFTDRIKSMPGVTVLELRRGDQEAALSRVLALLQERLEPGVERKEQPDPRKLEED